MGNHVYIVDGSIAFTLQIPDDEVGCSGSRCANCGVNTAYCNQICRRCGMPYIGPFGFPQYPEWLVLSTDEKIALVVKIFASRKKGRLGYANVAFIPLTTDELIGIERLEGIKARLFYLTHEIFPQNIRNVLLV